MNHPVVFGRFWRRELLIWSHLNVSPEIDWLIDWLTVHKQEHLTVPSCCTCSDRPSTARRSASVSADRTRPSAICWNDCGWNSLKEGQCKSSIIFTEMMNESTMNWIREPTPSPFGFKWEPSTKDELKDYDIGEQLSRIDYPRHKVAFWNDYLPSLERLARGEVDALNPTLKPPFDSRFRTGHCSFFSFAYHSQPNPIVTLI